MDAKKNTILDASPEAVQGLMNQASVVDDAGWLEDDLKAVFGHQWSTPLGVDLSGLDEALADQIAVMASSRGLVLNSFGDLLRHPNPPLPLLEMCKEFAKRSLYSPCPSLPKDVARVLYFTSIAAALSHCHARISSLSPEELEKGMKWGLSRDWITKEAVAVLKEGIKSLRKMKGGVA